MPELESQSHPEVNDLLRRIEAHVTEPERRAALECLLREHAGDSLDDIAKDLAVAPATLRKRLSRLRRHLRAAYALPLAFVLAAMAGLAWKRSHAMLAPVSASAAASDSLSAFAGEWRVTGASAHAGVASELTVLVGAHSAWVRDPTGLVVRELQLRLSGPERLTVSSDGAVWETKLGVTERDRVTLTSARGYVVLERMDARVPP